MTIGELREAIKDLPADAPVCIDWALGEAPRDHDPGVRLFGWNTDEKGNLIMRVGLFYLDELDDEYFEIEEDNEPVANQPQE